MTLPGTTIDPVRSPMHLVLTLKQASELSPYSADYLNLLARKGKIKAIKLGRDWVVARQDLFEYLKKQEKESKNRLGELNKYLNLTGRVR